MNIIYTEVKLDTLAQICSACNKLCESNREGGGVRQFVVVQTVSAEFSSSM